MAVDNNVHATNSTSGNKDDQGIPIPEDVHDNLGYESGDGMFSHKSHRQ